jgi:hypothetical protein
MVARPAGFEPTTPWIVGDSGAVRSISNQSLASLAVVPFSMSRSQAWHSQYGSVTIDCHYRWNDRFRPILLKNPTLN